MNAVPVNALPMTLQWGPLAGGVLAAALVLMGLLAVIAHRRRDMGLVDLGWTAGVGLAVLAGALLLDGAPWRRAAIAALALLWATRLCTHMLRNRLRGRPEDARYRALRTRWGARAERNAVLLFLAEAPLIVLFALPAWIAMGNPAAAPTPWDALALVLGLGAVLGEAAADRQLERFRANPAHRGRTCRSGWWRYSRHPNYFFEWLHWWAYAAFAVGAPLAAVTLLGPALMLLFLCAVTGIPHAERQALASRGDDYRRYQAATSVFFPWFPRTEDTP